MVKVVALISFLTLAACQTASGSFCDLNRPQRLSEAEIAALSDEQVEEALRINELGQRLCGWRP